MLTIYYGGSLVTNAVNVQATLLVNASSEVSFDVAFDQYATWLARMDLDFQVRHDATTSMGWFFITKVINNGSYITVSGEGTKGKLKYWMVTDTASKCWLEKGVVGTTPTVNVFSLELNDDEDADIVLPANVVNKYLIVEDGTNADIDVDCNLGPDAGATPALVGFSASVSGMDGAWNANAYKNVGTDIDGDGTFWTEWCYCNDDDQKEMALDLDIENYEIPATAEILNITIDVVGQFVHTIGALSPIRDQVMYLKMGLYTTTPSQHVALQSITLSAGSSVSDDVNMHIHHDITTGWFDQGATYWEGGKLYIRWSNKDSGFLGYGDILQFKWDSCKVVLTYRTATFSTINTKIISLTPDSTVNVAADTKGYITDVVADVTGHIITLTHQEPVDENALAGLGMVVDGHTYVVDSNTQGAIESESVTYVGFPTTSLSGDGTRVINDALSDGRDTIYQFVDDGHAVVDCCTGLLWSIYVTAGHVYAVKDGVTSTIAGAGYCGCAYYPAAGDFPTGTYPNECFVLFRLTESDGRMNIDLWTDVAGTMTDTTKTAYIDFHSAPTIARVRTVHEPLGSSPATRIGIIITLSDHLYTYFLNFYWLSATSNMFGNNMPVIVSPDDPVGSNCDKIVRITDSYFVYSYGSATGWHTYYTTSLGSLNLANILDDGDTGDDMHVFGTDGTYIYAISDADSHVYKGTLDIANNPDSVTWTDLNLDILPSYPFTEGAVYTDKLVLYNGDVFTTLELPVVPFAITMIEEPVAGDETNDLVLNVPNDFYARGVVAGDSWIICLSMQEAIAKIFTSSTTMPTIWYSVNNGEFINRGISVELPGTDADTMWNTIMESMGYVSYVDAAILSNDVLRADAEANLPTGTALTGFTWINDHETENNKYGYVSLRWADGIVTEATGIDNFKTYPINDKSILTKSEAIAICHAKVLELTTYHRSIHLKWMSQQTIRVGYVYTFTIGEDNYTEYCRRVTYNARGSTIEIDAYFGGGYTPADEALGRKVGLLERSIKKQIALPVATTTGGGGGTTYTDADAQAACIAQAITNGVVDKAPSEDVVFDALAAKDAIVTATSPIVRTANNLALKNDAATTITGIETTWTDSHEKLATSKAIGDAMIANFAPIHPTGTVADADTDAVSGDTVFHAIAAAGGWSGDFGAVEGLADHGYKGETFTATAGENLAIGDFVYFKSDTKMWKAKADAIATAKCIGVCVVAGNAEAEVTIMTYGFIRHDAFAAMTVGGIVYLSTGTAGIQQKDTVPSANLHCIVVLGQAIADYILFFNPNNLIIEIIA